MELQFQLVLGIIFFSSICVGGLFLIGKLLSEPIEVKPVINERDAGLMD